MAPNSDPIALSNRAVECMENGYIRFANRLLNAALLRLLDMTDAESAQSIRFSWSQPAVIEQNGSLGDENTGLFMYSRGGVLRGGPRPNLGPTSEERAVIVYNAALAAHLLANVTAKSAVMNRAKSLYILSRHILRTRRAAGAKSSLWNKHFFHIAILNNLGQINYELTEFAIAKTYFACTKQIVLFLASSRQSEESQIYCMSDLKGMRGNAILDMPTAAACA
jgi:hypothetical protein